MVLLLLLLRTKTVTLRDATAADARSWRVLPWLMPSHPVTWCRCHGGKVLLVAVSSISSSRLKWNF